MKESIRNRDEEVFKFQGDKETEVYQEVEMDESTPEDERRKMLLESSLAKKTQKKQEMYRSLQRLNLI